MLKIFIFIFLSNFAIYANIASQKMSLGGNIGIPMSYDRHDEFKLRLKIAPYFGYFFADNWELRGQFKLDYKFSSQTKYTTGPVFWDLSAMAIYHFNTSSMWKPYIGGGLGYRTMDLSVYASRLFLEVPMGTLIEINKNFYIDIGIPFRWYWGSVRSLVEKFEFPIAFLGIKYVF